MTPEPEHGTRVDDHGFVEQGIGRIRGGAGERDAESVLARATDLLRTVRATAGDDDAELFVRTSSRLTVSLGRSGGDGEVAAGRESGLAVRVRTADGRLGFAARSGFDEVTARDATLEAAARTAPGDDVEASWAPGGERTLRDLDDVEAPTVAASVAWLERAREALARRLEARRRDAVEPLDTRLDVAATVEALVATDGVRALRTRCRGRATARTRRLVPPGEPRVLELAARDWRALDADGWVELLDDRAAPGRTVETTVDPRNSFIFSPEASSTLVQALVRTMHFGRRPVRVGPGWCVRDDPGGAGGAFGSTFDDAGYAAEPVELADGRDGAVALPVEGRLRRGAYRDRPAPRAWHLIVDPPEVPLPARCVLVSACRVLALDAGRWCLELDAASLDAGTPTASHPRGLVMVDPAVLLERCVGGVGAIRSIAGSVRTPALVFDGLRSRRGVPPG